MQDTQHFHKPYTDDWDEQQPEPGEPTEAALPSPSAPPVNPSAPFTLVHAVGANAAPFVTPSIPAPTPTPIPASQFLDRFPGMASRTALFSVGRFDKSLSGVRKVACYEKDMEITLDGPMLTLEDKRVWEVALSAAKTFGGAGVEFKLSANRIADKLGRSPTGKTTAAIAASLQRLAAAQIVYKTPEGATGCAKLLESADKQISGWRVAISLDLLAALRDHKQFAVDGERRKRLKSDIARWLHDFLSTHQPAYKTKHRLVELAALCGARSNLSHFPTHLQAALEDILSASPELLECVNWERPEKEWTSWWITMVKGAENATFVWPAEEERRAQAKRDATERKKAAKSRRAGPNL